MKVVFGLGNPGLKYRYTRHNVGFLILDHLAHFFFKEFESESDLYKLAKIDIDGNAVLLVKPTTYMNLSGIAVRSVIENYNIALENILVVVDDFNLPLGTIRIRSLGSDGGHNGLISIIEEIEENRFTRLRFGIGGPEKDDVVEFVLGKFSSKEFSQLDELIDISANAVKDWVTKDIDELMNDYNRQHLTK